MRSPPPDDPDRMRLPGDVVFTIGALLMASDFLAKLIGWRPAARMASAAADMAPNRNE